MSFENGAFCMAALESTLETLSGKKVIFRSDFSKETIPLQSISSVDNEQSTIPIMNFSSAPREINVASIDSSCALVGETEQGAIYAGRVATVYSVRGKIRKYYRAGPVIFYLGADSINSDICSRINKKILKLILFDRTIAERFIRIYLERGAQLRAASALEDSMIVVDGALRSSLLETRGTSLGELQVTCRNNLNQLIGFSKSSSLRMISRGASILQSQKKGQIFMDLTQSIGVILPGIGSSRITVAKFCANSPVFRVDFSSSNTEDEAQLLADLRHNDALFRGYPESLRLAHHLSVFDSSTISSVRSYLSKRYGLIPVPSDDLRATILGKFV